MVLKASAENQGEYGFGFDNSFWSFINLLEIDTIIIQLVSLLSQNSLCLYSIIQCPDGMVVLLLNPRVYGTI